VETIDWIRLPLIIQGTRHCDSLTRGDSGVDAIILASKNDLNVIDGRRRSE